MGWLIFFLTVLFAPLIISALTLVQLRKFRRRLDDAESSAERRERRLANRIAALEGPGMPLEAPAPAPAAPVKSKAEVLRATFMPPTPLIVQAPPPPISRKEPEERVPLENLIGERILPRLGVIAIVLGLGLLVWYSYVNLGPKGRLTLAGVTGALMVGGGIYLRRHEFTRLLGSCLIGGGWAVMYITSYAAHFVEPSRVIDNPLLGFLLLLAVAQAALFHAWRYRSETIAGLAYLLTIVTLFLSPAPGPASWLAMGVSAAVLVALAWREKWIRFCALGAAMLYGAEVFWLSQTPPADIVPALAVLVSLWAMWTLPDYFHRPSGEGPRQIHGLLIALNFGGLLLAAALVHRWFALEYMGWVWLTLGALYLVQAILGRKRAWRPAYLADLAFAAIFLGIGAHEQFTGLGPVFAWIAVSVGLFAWGAASKDEVPKFLGIAALVATFGRFWIADWRMDHAYLPGLLISGLLYAGSAGLSQRSSQAARLLSHLGAFALCLVIWHHPPELMRGMLLAFSGLALVATGSRSGARRMTTEGLCLLALAGLWVVTTNLAATGEIWGVSRRIVSTVPVLLAWLGARWILPREEGAESARGVFGIFALAGLLALLQVELGAAQTPAAWAVACGAWYLWSRVVRDDVQFLSAAAAAAATLVAYATAPALRMPVTEWAGPVPSGVAILAIFLGIHLASRRAVHTALHGRARDAFAAAMAVAGFVLLDREMSGTWLTVSWATLGLGLAAYGFLVRDRVSRWSSLLVLGVCVGKVVFFDLATFEMPVKIATLITLGTIMVTLSFVYARHHRRIVTYLAGRNP